LKITPPEKILLGEEWNDVLMELYAEVVVLDWEQR
jgi:hypothetical protein